MWRTSRWQRLGIHRSIATFSNNNPSFWRILVNEADVVGKVSAVVKQCHLAAFFPLAGLSSLFMISLPPYGSRLANFSDPSGCGGAF